MSHTFADAGELAPYKLATRPLALAIELERLSVS